MSYIICTSLCLVSFSQYYVYLPLHAAILCFTFMYNISLSEYFTICSPSLGIMNVAAIHILIRNFWCIDALIVLSLYIKIRMTKSWGITYSDLANTLKIFKMVVSIYVHRKSVWELYLLYIPVKSWCSFPYFFFFFNLSHSSGRVVIAYCGFNLHFPNNYRFEDVSMYLLGSCISCFLKWLFSVLSIS